MKRWQVLMCGVIWLSVATYAHAQQTVVAPSRSVDWRSAGVIGGIPNRTTICSSLSPGATAAQINSAIAACPSGQVVFLNAGTYSLSGGIVLNKNNVTLRGAGSATTKLVISGTTSNCHVFYNSTIQMCAAASNIGADSADHSANWTAGYAQGTSVITLSSTAGLAVGSTLWLDQLDDSADGYPAAGDIYTCSGSYPCSNQGGGTFYRGSRSETIGVMVTAISGTNVTINPPVYMPNFRSSQSPGAWWGNTNDILQNTGLENLTVDFTPSGAVGVQMVNCTNCWIRGVRWIWTAPTGSFIFHNFLLNCFHCQLESNYYYGPASSGGSNITNYQIAPHVVALSVFQNNIQHTPVSAYVPNDPTTASVYAYNFVTGSWFTGPGPIEHTPEAMMNLYEGNNTSGFLGDIIHGPHYFETLFRNLFDGQQTNPPGIVSDSVSFRAHNRFANVVGNVMGDSYHNTYQSNMTTPGTSIYSLGWQGNDSISGPSLVANDPNVIRTIFRWGNWDKVTNATRWCGTSADTGWSTVCGATSEVPSGITSYAQPVPPTETLPASFYLSAAPSFFGAVSWPPIGPDVTGGTVLGFAGHANKIPARLCYEAAANDPAYPNSSPRVKLIDAVACYGQSSGSAPSAPTNLRIVAP